MKGRWRKTRAGGGSRNVTCKGNKGKEFYKGNRKEANKAGEELPIHVHVMRSEVDGDDCLEPEGILWIRRT